MQAETYTAWDFRENMKKIWKILAGVFICSAMLCGCGVDLRQRALESESVQESGNAAQIAGSASDNEVSPVQETEMIEIESEPDKRELRKPVAVKGIYLTAHVAGSESWLDSLLDQIQGTEINAVVIDVKDDSGRITYAMNLPVADEIDAVKEYIPDVEELIRKLKERDIYVIARVVAFRDPYLAEQRPEWSLKNADGSIFRDRKGLAWVNPYRQEVWDYLVNVGIEAGKAGFDEIQFDYIRFCTEKGIQNVVFDEAETKGRGKTDIITEFIDYAYDKLADEGIFVSADVFGAIIGSEEDSSSVGQIYGEMAKHLDYICPMIYPSHYGNGSFGVQYPDKQPYPVILGALQGSQAELKQYAREGVQQAVVRPWLQDFTASYLDHYIRYGDEQVRAQIQAVYDAGYDEWILWNASCNYHFGAMLSKEDGEAEALARAEARERAAEEAARAAEESSRAMEEAAEAEESSRAAKEQESSKAAAEAANTGETSKAAERSTQAGQDSKTGNTSDE